MPDLRWSGAARQAMVHVPPGPKTRLRAALRDLAEGRTTSVDVRPLRGHAGLVRVRVGSWRAVVRSGTTMDVIRVFQRRDGYDWLDAPKPL